jgi:hypothetical protein
LYKINPLSLEVGRTKTCHDTSTVSGKKSRDFATTCSRDMAKDAKLVECRSANYRLRSKWSLLYKHVFLAQNVFQVSFKHKIYTLSGSTDPFDTRKGLRKGDSLSYILFKFPWRK